MKIIDLTHSIDENMPMYPGDDAPQLHVAYSHEEFGYIISVDGLSFTDPTDKIRTLIPR